MGKINAAVVMCGGDSSRFGYVCKPLVMYKGRVIVTYVFEALNELGVENVILKTNPSNNDMIGYLASKYFDDFVQIPSEPKPMRYVIRDIRNQLSGDFYVVVGNQPMPASHLDYMGQLKRDGSWIVSLYTAKTDGSVMVVKKDENKLALAQDTDLKAFFLQHPFILNKDIIKEQEIEGFSGKLEQTIGRLLSVRDIAGVAAPMPPEFDTWEMFEANKKYIDEQLRK